MDVSKFLWSSEAAGWVQAIGSIIAIFVAIGVAAWQAKASRDLVKENAQADMRRRIEALLGMLSAANQEIWRCRRYLLRGSSVMRNGSLTVLNVETSPLSNDIQRLDTVLEAIPLHELPSWPLAAAVMEMRRVMWTADTVTKRLDRTASYPDNQAQRANPLVVEVLAAREILANAHGEAIRLLGEMLPLMQTEFPQDPES